MSQTKTPLPDNKNPNFLDQTWNFFHDLIDLKDGLDKEGTIINIKSNKEMQGANAWLLMCSILIASLGLDLNSPAVIIGAMLISPLMAPILGIGLGIGINDRNTLTISGKHLLIAIGIALVTSTIYFALTNWIGIAQGFTDEIKGRTRPSILDAMVALIGGLAGIISSSRKDKSNAIPGVAIATALMPPLCVTGYGLAQWLGTLFGAEGVNPNYSSVIFNSFFLFVLNATLVALGTYFIVRFMDFPSKSFDSEKEKRRTKMFLYGTSLLLLSISIFTTYTIITENNTIKNIEKFVVDHDSELRLVDHEIIKEVQGNSFTIEMDIMETLSPEQCKDYNVLLQNEPYNVTNAEIKFTYPSEEELKEIARKNGEDKALIQGEINQLKNDVDSLSEQITFIQNQEKIKTQKNLRFFAKSNFPELKDIKFFTSMNENDPASLALQWEASILKKEKIKTKREIQLIDWTKEIMEVDSILITYLAN